MGIFLVLRNNTRRNFRKRSTYVLFVAIPLMVLLFGMVSENIKQKSYVIGVISEQSLEWGAVPEGIRVVSIKPEHANTEVIMGNCDVVVTKDALEKEIQRNTKHTKMEWEEGKEKKNVMKQMLGMVCTVYFVFATLYASKVIRDKKEGGLARFEYAGGKRVEYYMGNLLSTFIVVFCQVAMVLVVLWMVYGENVISGRSAALLTLCISLVSAMVGGIVATLAKSELGANVSVTIFAVLCSVFGGTFLAVEQMPGILGMIGKCSPIYWMICLLG